MDISIYILILFLIILKLMIWVCVFYTRQQRQRRLLSNPQGIIIIPGSRQVQAVRDNDGIIANEHVTGYPGYPGVDNAGMVSMQPPSYDQAQQSKAMEEKPPSYEQVVADSQQPSYPTQSTVNAHP